MPIEDGGISRDMHQLDDVKSMSGNGMGGFGANGMENGDDIPYSELGTP
jgi:hypothetical protein